MQRARIVNDLYELSMNTRVAFDLDDGWALVRNVHVPEGWEPDPIDIRLEFDDYPALPPVVYVPDDLRFEGSRPIVMPPPSTQDDPEWCQLDVQLGTSIEWDPTTTISDVVRLTLYTLREQIPSGSPDDFSPEATGLSEGASHEPGGHPDASSTGEGGSVGSPADEVHSEGSPTDESGLSTDDGESNPE